MTRDEVARVVTNMITQILPEIPPAEIQPHRGLASLGATSIDRVEIALGAMETLGLVMRPAEFAGITTIGALIDLLHARLQANPSSPRPSCKGGAGGGCAGEA